ncbi:MAG: hypothetical protein H6Q17_2133 [Bacteroidetes bacterium]|nr:hypothetical protein [Bacteroidota bacterium]
MKKIATLSIILFWKIHTKIPSLTLTYGIFIQNNEHKYDIFHSIQKQPYTSI